MQCGDGLVGVRTRSTARLVACSPAWLDESHLADLATRRSSCSRSPAVVTVVAIQPRSARLGAGANASRDNRDSEGGWPIAERRSWLANLPRGHVPLCAIQSPTTVTTESERSGGGGGGILRRVESTSSTSTRSHRDVCTRRRPPERIADPTFTSTRIRHGRQSAPDELAEGFVAGRNHPDELGAASSAFIATVRRIPHFDIPFFLERQWRGLLSNLARLVRSEPLISRPSRNRNRDIKARQPARRLDRDRDRLRATPRRHYQARRVRVVEDQFPATATRRHVSRDRGRVQDQQGSPRSASSMPPFVRRERQTKLTRTRTHRNCSRLGRTLHLRKRSAIC